MAAAINDVLRFTDIQTLLGETALNVYFYKVNVITGLGGDYLDTLGAWFRDTVLPPIVALQVTGLEHTELFMENLTNGIDIEHFVTGYPVVGEQAGGVELPPFVTYSFQLLRETRSTRNGAKRIAGVSSANVNDGVYVGDPAEITAVEDVLGADIVIGIVNIAQPVIVKHPIDVPLVAPVTNSISAGLFSGLGSQNTRKFGRGV